MSFAQSLRGAAAPDPSGAAEGDLLAFHQAQVTNPSVAYTTPRAIVSDSTHIYVAQGTQPSNAISSPLLFKLTVSGGVVTNTQTIDLSGINPSVSEARALAEDATYLYVSCGDSGNNIAIVDKVTFTVVGWANTAPLSYGFPYGVATDGVGNFYVAMIAGMVAQYSTASLLGQPYTNVVPPTQTVITPGGGIRQICYGGGKLWVVSGNNGPTPLYRIDPTSMTIDLSTPDLNGDTWAMAVIYAFGYVWVTSGNSGVGVHQVNPSDLSVANTIAPTGGFSGTIAGIGTGADNLGNPNAWLYVSSRNQNQMGVINPTGPTWVETLTGTTSARYEGVTSIGNYTYFAGLIGVFGSVPTIDWVDVPAYTQGALTAASPQYNPTLRYVSPVDGVTQSIIPFVTTSVGTTGIITAPAQGITIGKVYVITDGVSQMTFTAISTGVNTIQALNWGAVGDVAGTVEAGAQIYPIERVVVAPNTTGNYLIFGGSVHVIVDVQPGIPTGVTVQLPTTPYPGYTGQKIEILPPVDANMTNFVGLDPNGNTLNGSGSGPSSNLTAPRTAGAPVAKWVLTATTPSTWVF